LVDWNSSLKQEATRISRKISACEERTDTNISALLQEVDHLPASQNQRFELHHEAIKDRLDQAR
ncbi:hypothetical protein EDB89DRAFT_1821769, partial [Lactarius sanguifluus]